MSRALKNQTRHTRFDFNVKQHTQITTDLKQKMHHNFDPDFDLDFDSDFESDLVVACDRTPRSLMDAFMSNDSF